MELHTTNNLIVIGVILAFIVFSAIITNKIEDKNNEK